MTEACLEAVGQGLGAGSSRLKSALNPKGGQPHAIRTRGSVHPHIWVKKRGPLQLVIHLIPFMALRQKENVECFGKPP